MDRAAYTRKRRQAPGQPTTKPPVRLSRDKKDTQKARATQASAESNTSPLRVDTGPRTSVESEANVRSFTVGNVGRNGTLYLKPSRATSQHTQPPATPTSTAGRKTNTESRATDEQGRNGSSMATPKITTGNAFNTTLPIPPPVMPDMPQQGRPRSYSMSTIDDATRVQPHEATEFQILLNGQDPRQRPKSSLDLFEGLASFRIPHYRLGTPRFGDRGTAYLHNSIRSSITEDLRSSVFSKPEYDRFPAPPGQSRHASGGLYLHPSQATSSFRSSRTPSQRWPNRKGQVDLTMYDHIEANINGPSLVRYSVTTGRIMAATPGRLIAQITSPWFLDYELLSNFFLTYRNFLTSHELLVYLLVRMEWALANGSDSGRIVTVRTFVALRHWILNYFPDDFLPDYVLRQKFCNLVNGIAHALQRRFDHGGSDLNVIGELKKCWRRICAMFWMVPDVAEPSPGVDISPGDDEGSIRIRASATSFIQSGQHDSALMDFRRSSLIQLPAPIEEVEIGLAAEISTSDTRAQYARTASIPATPNSEQSLTVLSCSVPFLKHMMPAPTPRQNRLQKERPSSERSSVGARRHKYSASLSDAVRNERAPLSSERPESAGVQPLPTTSFTGGLVRGLLLQPSPSKVDLLIPLSPPLETQIFDFGAAKATPPPALPPQPTPGQWRNPNVGVKKAVGDVRRALSHRATPVSSNRSTNSSGSRSSGHSDRADHPASWQQLSGPPRVDVLGEKIADSYKEAFEEVADLEIAPPLSYDHRGAGGMRLDFLNTPSTNRQHSHVTTGSRSIVIVDDTGLPDVPLISGALPPLTPRSRAMAPKPLFGVSPEIPQGFDPSASPFTGASSTGPPSDVYPMQSPELPMHDLLAVPGIVDSSGDEFYDITQARKSSTANPLGLDIPSIQHQLKRRPGGDLKVADHVQDLERIPRPQTGDSYSTFSQAILSSGEPSVDFSNVHVVGQDDHGLQIPLSFLQGRKKDSWTLLPTHSSQPNMRPSMKAKVSHLAKLPDDATDGGIEDALAKLEGKAASPTASTHAMASQEDGSEVPSLVHYPEPGRLLVMNDTANGYESSSLRSPNTDRQGASIYRMSDDTNFNSYATGSPSVHTIHGLFGDAQASQATLPATQVVALSESAVASLNGNEASKTLAELQSGDSQRSFLLDDQESLSDISTEIAEEHSVEDDNIGVRSFYFDDTVDDEVRHVAPHRPPRTPPPMADSPIIRSGEMSPTFSLGPVEPKSLKAVMSPPQPLKSNPPQNALWPAGPEARRSLTGPLQKNTAHLPFVLAFESDVIAEQLTIIEKDALDEVEWKDLIGLNWQHAALKIHNWVEFLKREDCNGIDIVVSRFNLVVKWVVSECILTEAPSERARCIVKFIHIAAHAHRLRNYATLYQITLALLSSDLARLHKTWSLVPAAEKETLARLEKLCQPRGNFHSLRAEMESASADDACIPFIGLYTHDLMFNAQKPARIDPSPPGGEPLVNFERYQTAAAIVKSLLTLIEASARYVFRPHPEVLSRCLWLAALPDCEVSARSKSLEQ